jgi:hypothetical protein
MTKMQGNENVQALLERIYALLLLGIRGSNMSLVSVENTTSAAFIIAEIYVLLNRQEIYFSECEFMTVEVEEILKRADRLIDIWSVGYCETANRPVEKELKNMPFFVSDFKDVLFTNSINKETK